MKCVCGYEYDEEWNSEERRYVVILGDKPFIRLYTSNDIKVYYKRRSDYYSNGEEEVSLYACPKCGTVKVDI